MDNIINALKSENKLFSINKKNNQKALKHNINHFLELCKIQNSLKIQMLTGILELVNLSDAPVDFYTLDNNLIVISIIPVDKEKLFSHLFKTTKISQDDDKKIKFAFLIPLSSHVNMLQSDIQDIVISLRQNMDESVYLELKHKEQLGLQSRQAQMGEMVSMIAHQWRQPLSAISTIALKMRMGVLLNKYNFDSEQACEIFLEMFNTSLEEIESHVTSLSATIDDFRTFNKPEKKSTKSSINEAVLKSLKIVSHTLELKGIKVQTQYHSKNNIMIYTNELSQVVLNIIKNAQDNFDEKSIDKPKISITTRDIQDGAQIEISDNGGGIPKSVISRIFEPYYSTKAEKNGTGLGLYMSKMIIEEHHHGSIEVSNCNGGAFFKITINN